MQKGFISISSLIIIFLGTALLGGGTFAAYEYSQVLEENSRIEAELVAQKNTEIANLKEQLEKNQEQVVVETDATSTEDTLDVEVIVEEQVAEEPEVKEVIKTVIEYVPVEVPAEAKIEDNEPVSEEVQPEPEEVSIAEEPEESVAAPEVNPISVLSVGQTAFPDSFGGVYGSYGMTLRVQPETADIYIPMTTNDSLGTGEIGFAYKVTGQSFRGRQDSEVTECTNFQNNLCKFKVGQDKNIKVTVWLFPDEDSSGNFGINFQGITYFEGGERKEFTLNQETALINLYY